MVTIVNGRWEENCYIVAGDEGNALVIDPGSGAGEIMRAIDDGKWRVSAIVNTHGHYDHIGAVAEMMEHYDVPFYLHAADEKLLRRANLYRMLWEAGDAVRIPRVTHDLSSLPSEITIAGCTLSWTSAPGHTAGSVCLQIGNYLFSGDTLMRGAIGRTDLPGGDRKALLASVRKLSTLPGETVVCGGHGPRTTIAAEFSRGARVGSLLE